MFPTERKMIRRIPNLDSRPTLTLYNSNLQSFNASSLCVKVHTSDRVHSNLLIAPSHED